MEKLDVSGVFEPGAFDEAITGDGRVDVKRLARLLDLPLATIAPALGLVNAGRKLTQVAPKSPD